MITAGVIITLAVINVPAQTVFKGETLSTSIIVRIKRRPGTKPSPTPTAVSKKGPNPQPTYADDLFNHEFEDALNEGNEGLAASDFQAALIPFERARAMTIDDPRPLIGLGGALIGLGQFDLAVNRFQAAAKVYEASSTDRPSEERKFDANQIYSGWGFASLKAGSYDESSKAYERVIGLDGKAGVVVHNNLGIAYANLLMYPEAEQQFLQALALDRKDQLVRLNLGMIYVMMRNREKAAAAQRELVADDPYRAGLLQREIDGMR